MSATDTTNQNQQKQSSLAETNLTRLSYYHINPSYTLRVICCVLFIFLTEICLAHYIYRLINAEIRDEYVPKSDVQQKFFTFIRSEIGRNEITKLLKEIERDEKASTSSSSPMSMSTSSYNTLIKNNRRKRGALSLDENLLNIANDGPNVEFFNPELRADLEAREDKYRKATGGKGSAPGGDSWVWLTSYSRIPVSCFFFVFCFNRVHLKHEEIYSTQKMIFLMISRYTYNIGTVFLADSNIKLKTKF